MNGSDKKNIQEQPSDFQVNIIPGDFYAGANPVIKFRNVEKEVVIGKTAKPSEVAALNKANAAGGFVNVLTSSKFLAVGAAVLFVLFVIGASAYYWWQGRTPVQIAPQPVAEQTAVPTQPEQPAEPINPTSTVPAEAPTSSVPTDIVATPIESALEFPSAVLGDSANLDDDDLTDVAEEVFATDPGNPDSDEDNYDDGREVFNLYNPTGKEPMKLIESGQVDEFSNPTFGYKVYFPKVWASGNVDKDYRDMLFSGMTGENIELRVYDLEFGQSFIDWFGKNAVGQKIADLEPFVSVFKENGYKRKDYLVFYFTDNLRVYVIAYHAVDPNTINYRSIVKMMARSFRLNGNTTAQPMPVLENSESTTTGNAVESTSSENFFQESTTTP